MLLVPKSRAALSGLNSYYLKIERLVEHMIGEYGCGLIHFTFGQTDITMVFDLGTELNWIYRNGDRAIEGDIAKARAFSELESGNFIVSVYELEDTVLDLFANAVHAIEVFSNLDAEFTDFTGLLIKMVEEGLTGYVEVKLTHGGSAYFMMISGEQVAAYFNFRGALEDDEEANLELLSERISDNGATFNVYKIDVEAAINQELEEKEAAEGGEGVRAANVMELFDNDYDPSKIATPAPAKEEEIDLEPDTVAAIGELFRYLEDMALPQTGGVDGFKMIMNRTFLALSEEFPFLDPFIDEFSYVDRTVGYAGDERPKVLFEGALAALGGIAEEFGVFDVFQKQLKAWKKKRSGLLKKAGCTVV